MKRLLKIISLLLLVVVLVCGTSYLMDKNSLNNWQISTLKRDNEGIGWSKFIWTNDTLGGKYYEKTAMLIPVKVDGLPGNYTFQFDLGADATVIYEANAQSVFEKYSATKNSIGRMKSPLEFWNSRRAYNNLNMTFGDMNVAAKNCRILENYGEKIDFANDSKSNGSRLGTIGTDLFQNKVLVIDYPNQRFAICDSVPAGYNANMVNIELDKSGRVILPMKLKSKAYRIMFDNGSSLFPIITQAKNISNFSTTSDIDTIEISSWGKKHKVTGKVIKDTFELAGQKFANVKVYANHADLGIDTNTDGMTGNALFWDKTIIIDFKNKRFAVKN